MDTISKEIIVNDEKQKTFYNKLREKIKNWLQEHGIENKHSEYLLLAPDLFYLLIKLIKDERVPQKEKIKIGVVIAYFISPIDLMPEFIFGPIGFIDDVAIAAFALNGMLNKIDEEVLKENWVGEGDILIQIKQVIDKADSLLGKGLVKKIKQYIE